MAQAGTDDALTRRQLAEAVAAQQQRRLDDAARLYEAVLARAPRNADALHLLGVISAETGQPERAAALMEAALRENSHAPSIHFNWANLLQASGRLREAVAHYDIALALAPEAAECWYNRGNALVRMGLCEDSLASFEAALLVRPAYPAALLNKGVAEQNLGRFAAAAASFEAALALRPFYVQALCNLGNVLRITGQWDAARQVCEEAVRRHPGHADAHVQLGNVLQNLNAQEAALECYAQALALNPDHVNAHWNGGLTLLRLGRYAEGWRGFEWRKRLSTPVAVRGFAQPEWLGGGELRGKRVFLHWEMGLGDTLQFCRYAPLVRALGAEVVLAVPDPLVRLVRGMDKAIDVISTHAVPRHFDLHCPLMSLPLALGTTLATVPAAIPYLHADPAQAAMWRARLAALPGLKVGLVWSGAPRPDAPEANAVDQRRSLKLAQLGPLARVRDMSFVSLQKGPPAADAATPPPGMVLHDWTAELGDFLDTAGLVAGLDLVISVDTSVAHLAGALGRPLWVLNRSDHCWRWLDGEGTSPWYPSARLFRQASPGDWSAVLTAVADALHELGARG